jgi:glycosyltransferase involved in cell wall biosynthesis
LTDPARPQAAAPLSILWLNQLDPSHPWAGGAERHIAEVGGRLAASGHRVTVVAERFGSLPVEETRGGLTVLRPVRRGFLHAWVLSNAQRLVDRFDVDVVLGDLSKIVPWGRSRFGGRPLVSILRHFNGRTVFGEVPFPTPPVLWSVERITPWLLKRSLVVTEAHCTADVLTQLGVPREHISLVPPGVDSQLYRVNPRQRASTPVIAYVGRLKRYKRVDLALDAFRIVLRTRPEAQLEIAGGGTDQGRLQDRARDLGVADSVRFLGRLSPAEIVALYQRSWVHVQPSAVEGWGLTALEAMACGTPVSAFDAGALRESVGPPCEDLLAPNGDVVALAESLLRALERPEVTNPVAAQALAAHAASFSWDVTALGYSGVLEGARAFGFGARPSAFRWARSAERPARGTDVADAGTGSIGSG